MRARIVELLALAKKPLSAYRVAKMYNLNVSKVYHEIKRLDDLGLLLRRRGSKGMEYSLVDENLRALALNLSPQIQSYDDWNSPEAKAQRFRAGLMQVPKFSLGRRQAKLLERKRTRMPDELDTLALLARRSFEKKYREIGEREYVRI